MREGNNMKRMIDDANRGGGVTGSWDMTNPTRIFTVCMQKCALWYKNTHSGGKMAHSGAKFVSYNLNHKHIKTN